MLLRYSVVRLLRLIRYRFFLFAGIFPYLLGQVIARSAFKTLNWHYFWWGFLGIILVLVGVELFNEYFDGKSGGDRIFLEEKPQIPEYFSILGIFVFVLAFFIGLYLTFQIGWPILLFSFLGFLGAYFYVGPPLRWAYRGLGELVIAFSYGPLMVLGSFYLQTRHIDSIAFFVSLLCGLSIFCLALLNEIPDYYQDRLVGKRNLVVRLGRQRALKLLSLSLVSLFILLAVGMLLGKIPLSALVSFFFLPWMIKSLAVAQKDYEYPQKFIPAINAHIIIYLVITFSLGIGYWRR